MSSKRLNKLKSPGTPAARAQDPQSPLISPDTFSTNKTVNIIFQSKKSDETECSPSRILLNQSDMKQMGLKAGSLVNVNDALVCRAWPSKVQSQGYGVLNKIWSGLFEDVIKNRLATITKIDSEYEISNCRGLIVQYFGSSHNEKFEDFDDFKVYVHGLLDNVHFIGKLTCHLTWKNKPFILYLSPTEPSGHPDASEIHSISFTTNISMVEGTSSLPIVSSKLNNTNKADAIEDIIFSVTARFGGYNDIVRDCASLVELSLFKDSSRDASTNHFKLPRGFLITGPRGCGKTKLMNALVEEFKCHSIAINPTIMISKYRGDDVKELTSIFHEAKSYQQCIITIDDMDIIFPDRSSASDDSKRLVSCLLSLMDGVSQNSELSGRILIIATSSKPQAIDPAFRRPGRLDKDIELVVPFSVGRFDILKCLLKEMNIQYSDSGNISLSELQQVASLAHGMVGSDLELVIKEAFLIAYKRRASSQSIDDSISQLSLSSTLSPSAESRSTDNQVCVKGKDLITALSKVNPSALREVVIEVPNVKWSDIGGMNEVKQSLREVVEWPLLYPELFNSMGISPPRGVLLYGPPGCSKTLMAKALATESSMNFLAVRGPELLSKWLGESEKAVQTLFRRARAAAPSIVFFDEIDALTGKRGESNNGVNDRVLSQLLTEIDGAQGMKQVIVVAASNRPDLMDTALLRPGRIDRKIYVGPPDKESREQILRLHMNKAPLADDVKIEALVEKSNGFSGAEVAAIFSEAGYLAMEENVTSISQKHLLEVVKNTKPQITFEMTMFYETIKQKFKI